MTFQELDKHAEALDTEGMAQDFILSETEPDKVLEKVGAIYKKVRPFLELVGSFFFLPKKWRAAINTFIVVMDGVWPPTDKQY